MEDVLKFLQTNWHWILIAIAGIIFVHVAINIGMTIGLVPVIGIPLPFLSYGGSSMLAFTMMLAIFVKQDANRLNVL